MEKKKKTRKLTEISSPRVSQLREQVFFFLQLNIKASVKGDLINHFIGRIIGNKLLDN